MTPVRRDVLALPDPRRGPASGDQRVILRAQMALQSVAPVLIGNACLTRAGARYFGLEWAAWRSGFALLRWH